MAAASHPRTATTSCTNSSSFLLSWCPSSVPSGRVLSAASASPLPASASPLPGGCRARRRHAGQAEGPPHVPLVLADRRGGAHGQDSDSLRSWPRVPLPSWERGHSHCLARAGIRSPEQQVPYSPSHSPCSSCLHAAPLCSVATWLTSSWALVPAGSTWRSPCVLSGGEQD